MTVIELPARPEVVETLNAHRDRIMDALEGAATQVGRELIAAKAAHPGRFLAWVASELPFSVDKAQRLMAVARFADETDPKVLSALPKGWTILFELRRVPAGRLAEAVEAGEIDSGTSREAAEAFVRDELDPVRRLLTGTAETRPHKPRKGRPGPPKGTIPAAQRRPAGDSLARELIRTPRADLSEPMETLLRAWLGPEGDPHA